MIAALRAALERLFHHGQGRPLAIALLVLLAGINLAGHLTSRTTFFDALRQPLFDAYQRWQPRVPQSHPVAIVAIDEDSLHAIGQWPWPRDRVAALIDAIAAHQPAAIGLDIYFPEADRTAPKRVAERLPPQQAVLGAALRQLPDPDAQLATALRQAPTVLGAAGFDFATLTTSTGLRSWPLDIASGFDPLPHLRQYPWVLASLPELQAAAHGQALLSVDLRDGIARRLPLVMAVNTQIVPGLAMEMLRVATDSAIRIDGDARGVRSIGVADLTVPTQARGDMWLHFAPLAAGQGRYVPAVEVLNGRVDAEQLAGKLVLIGLTGMGLTDQRHTALGEQVPGIEIQAQALEVMFDGRLLLRPDWLPWLETLLLLALAGGLIWRVPRFGTLAPGALPPPPRASLWLTAALIAGLFVVGQLLFRQVGLLFDAASVSLILAVVLASLVRSVFLEISRRGAALAEERQRLREAAAKAAGELSAAHRIQLGSLPQADGLLRGEQRFTLAALLEPAQDVGGDLYDFFMIDERRLGFVIGDVSGKGLPASLFMAAAKMLARTLARHVKAGPDTIAALTNDELAEVNPEALFVTALIGVLDVECGELVLVNAGHDAPWLIHGDGSDGRVARLDCPADAGGPPLCMIDGFPYGAQRAQLAPGDTLVMITDGISEAMNASGEIYGTARLDAALAQAGSDDVNALVQRIRSDVGRHVAGAAPSDDLTLLVIRWTPAPDRAAA